MNWMKGTVVLKICLNERFRGTWWAGWLPVCCKIISPSSLCPHALSLLKILNFISHWTLLQDLFFPREVSNEALKPTSEEEERFSWRHYGHKHTCLCHLGLVLAWPWGDQVDRDRDLLPASLYFWKVTSLYFPISDFCLICLNCQLRRGVL